jgi:signal transduction histidine kinase
MGHSEAVDLRPPAVPDESELRLGDLAQELLPPLQAVRLGVALVRQDTPRASEVITKIDATLQAMERIVDELLDIGRARSGGLIIRARTGLAGICRSVVTDVSIRHPHRTIVLNAQHEAYGSWDGERLRQVVRNLLDNALEYGAPDAPVVLSVIDLDEQVLFAVVNRGQPISASVREHLFDPFPRSAGLGLHLVKRIVEAHRGSVAVESDEVRTVFRVALPKRFEAPGGIQ